MRLLLLASLLFCTCMGQHFTDLDGDGRIDTDLSALDFIGNHSELSEFSRLLRLDGLHRAFLERQVTIFAPVNVAFAALAGLDDRRRRSENLILNHMTNIALAVEQFPTDKLTSLVTGNPPLWITRTRRGTFVNQARVIRPNIRTRSVRGDQQIIHLIDSVLQPLAPISVRDAEYFVQLDARKLLTKSTLYDLGGHRVRVFNGQADLSRKTHMFGVAGQHTFFLPIDDAFDVSVPLSGYDHDRNRLKGSGVAGNRAVKSGAIRKELVDARVLEGHIIPHRLLFSSLAPTPEFPTVAWLENGIQVNASLQPTSLQGSYDVTIANKNREFDADRSFYNNRSASDAYSNPGGGVNGNMNVVVRSNTIVGDRAHARGMVVARIVRGNIPVQNGVVHLIDKPLMIVARSLYEYVMEEGRQPGNRLSTFAKLLRDKGGLFAEALLEAKDGSLMAPSNEAFERVDHERLDYILGNDYLRAEMLGLHFVRERVVSTEYKIQKEGDETYSTPASLAANRIWFHYSPRSQTLTVSGRGVNASVVEKDIGTINGVIHVVDRVLGVPHLTVQQMLGQDPNLSHMASLLRQHHMDTLFGQDPREQKQRFTLIVPTNRAWENAQERFGKAYNTMVEGQFPDYGKIILERHFTIGDRPLTFEELTEMSRRNPRRVFPMIAAQLTFSQQGEFKLNAYKDHYVTWNDLSAKVVRPNLECTNGIIHTIDTVLLDDAPPWQVMAAGADKSGLGAGFLATLIASLVALATAI